MNTTVQADTEAVLDVLRERRLEIERIAARHGAYNLRVFGSVARGEVTPESDIDLLVDAGTTVSPWFPAGMIVELEALLGRRVEVVTTGGLHTLLRERVFGEAVVL
ncbi:MAG: nucleotidyltransferase family protein [Anaerolineae bacterium]|nr:nucleotidyltransferase family protein [Anaerolineae bacterium]